MVDNNEIRMFAYPCQIGPQDSIRFKMTVRPLGSENFMLLAGTHRMLVNESDPDTQKILREETWQAMLDRLRMKCNQKRQKLALLEQTENYEQDLCLSTSTRKKVPSEFVKSFETRQSLFRVEPSSPKHQFARRSLSKHNLQNARGKILHPDVDEEGQDLELATVRLYKPIPLKIEELSVSSFSLHQSDEEFLDDVSSDRPNLLDNLEEGDHHVLSSNAGLHMQTEEFFLPQSKHLLSEERLDENHAPSYPSQYLAFLTQTMSPQARDIDIERLGLNGEKTAPRGRTTLTASDGEAEEPLNQDLGRRCNRDQAASGHQKNTSAEIAEMLQMDNILG